MNKIIEQLKLEWRQRSWKYKVLAVLSGIDTTMYICTPIILVVLWVSVVNTTNWSAFFFYIVGIISTLFRAFKIGVMR